MKGDIHSIETFGTVDGPGIRYVIFVQGCPMRCAYCHNPDTWEIGCGKKMLVDDLVEDIRKYTRYIEGITVSGGEPLLQMDFLIDLFQKVKKMGLATCIDTSGIVFDMSNTLLVSKLNSLLEYCDLVLLDIKHIDEEKHKNLTGCSNKNVLEFAKYLAEKGIPTWLRYVLVPGINDQKETLMQWKNFANTLGNVEKIEVLPYHRLAIEKYRKLGLHYRLEDIKEPTIEEIDIAKNILELKKGEMK